MFSEFAIRTRPGRGVLTVIITCDSPVNGLTLTVPVTLCCVRLRNGTCFLFRPRVHDWPASSISGWDAADAKRSYKISLQLVVSTEPRGAVDNTIVKCLWFPSHKRIGDVETCVV